MQTKFRSVISWPQGTFPTARPHKEQNAIYFQRPQIELTRHSFLAIRDNISLFSSYGVECYYFDINKLYVSNIITWTAKYEVVITL
jgi:hypothetical protein